MLPSKQRIRPYAVGLTGGVASGKTTLANAFTVFGIQVLSADQISRDVLSLPAVCDRLGELFGSAVLLPNGQANRQRLREIVFADARFRRQLEALVHPIIRQTLEQKVAMCAGPYSITEIPLLFEAGGRSAYPWLQRIATVVTSPALQLTHLLQREAMTPELAQRIIHAQASNASRIRIADDVIYNVTGSPASLQMHAQILHALYVRLANQATCLHSLRPVSD